jgi:hypothetical protein
MTPRQNAIKLMDIGKSVTELAKELHTKNPGVTEKSLWTMIDNMLKGRDYYPRYAEYLNAKYGFGFTRPAHKLPARQILKAA